MSIYGAMSMQGVMAYIYDEILQNTHVELDYCQFNHLGVGIYETFFSGAKVNNRICSKSNISDLYNIHYGGCRKPWLCPGEISYFDWFNTQNPLVSNHTHCMALHRVWHSVRTDLETQLLSLTGDMTINDGRVGSYMPDVFLGHCKSHGAEHYLSLSGSATTFQLIQSLYDKDDDAEKIMR